MSVTYRQVNCEDIENIYKIELACFNKPWSLESIRTDICGNEFSLYIIAEADGHAAGYCGVHVIFNEGHIMNVAVLPEYRKRGIGRGLLETIFMQTGLPYYTLEVRISNDDAVRLYDKLGFATVGIRPKYYGNEDALIMWKGKNTP